MALCVCFYRARVIRAPAVSDKSVSLAVLGDSDSHAYHDSVFFPPGSVKRGGEYRPTTWQQAGAVFADGPGTVALAQWGVLIRIGINNLGDARDLEQLAHDPWASSVQEKIASCGAQRGRR